MDMNVCTFVGRLADDVMYTPAKGDTPARAVGRLIVNRVPGKDKQPRYDTIPFAAWGAHADTFRDYTGKGKEVGFRGSLRHHGVRRADGSWENFYEILVEHVSLGRDSSAAKVAKAAEKTGVPVEKLAGPDLAAILDTPAVRKQLHKIRQAAQPEKVMAPAPAKKVEEEAIAENPFAD